MTLCQAFNYLLSYFTYLNILRPRCTAVQLWHIVLSAPVTNAPHLVLGVCLDSYRSICPMEPIELAHGGSAITPGVTIAGHQSTWPSPGGLWGGIIRIMYNMSYTTVRGVPRSAADAFILFAEVSGALPLVQPAGQPAIVVTVATATAAKSNVE